MKDKVNFGIPEGSPPPPGATPFAPQTVERVITLEDIVKNPGTPLESNERAMLDKWLQANRPAVEELRLGTAKPHCWFKYEVAQQDGRPGPLLSLLLPSIQGHRDMGLLLAWQMQFAAEKGDWDSVIADLKSAKTLARHLMQCPTLIEQLVGIAVDQRANKQLIHLLRSYPLPPSTLQRLAQSFPSEYPIIRMDGESLFQMDLIQWVFTDDGAGDGHVIPGRLRSLYADSYSEERQYSQLEILDSVGMSMIHSSRRNTVELFEQWKRRAHQYYLATPYQNYISAYALDAWSNKTIKENPRCFLANMFLPAVGRAVSISYARRPIALQGRARPVPR